MLDVVLMMSADYDKIEALNWSTLRHLATSARLLQWRAEHPQPDSRAMMLGRAIHCAVLEPERWASAYVARPDFGDGRTTAAKAAKADWLATVSPDVEVLDPDDHALATRCAEAVRSHPVAADMLRGGRAEETVVWTDPEYGIRCKSRMDYVTPRFVLDLKSSRAESLSAINREFAGRMYHGQLGMYHDGATAARVIDGDETPRSIVVQTVEPYDVVPLRLMRGDLDRGRALYRSLMRRYVECQTAGWWPGLAPGLVDLDLPAWAPGGDEQSEGW